MCGGDADAERGAAAAGAPSDCRTAESRGGVYGEPAADVTAGFEYTPLQTPQESSEKLLKIVFLWVLTIDCKNNY